MEIVMLLLSMLTWIILLAAFIFVVGIVWRVEAELDTAYKCFSMAVILYLLNEILIVLPSMHELPVGSLIITVVRFFSALMLFLGMYFMRDLVQKMDGEKKIEK